jgi:hypothetical protein
MFDVFSRLKVLFDVGKRRFFVRGADVDANYGRTIYQNPQNPPKRLTLLAFPT